VIIDCHGHFTTAPPALEQWRTQQVAAFDNHETPPDPAKLDIADDELREAIEKNQLAFMNERGSDLTIFSPRASWMAHNVGDFEVSNTWARIQNNLIARVAGLFPDRFAVGAMLPQSPGVDPATCLPELRRAVEDLGAVTVNLNPDPSGGLWSAPPLTDKSWYPIYEALVTYDIPAMIHVSTACNPVKHTTADHYLDADTTAFTHLIKGGAQLFADFPSLRLVIPHGGGGVPYHWGRFRGIAMLLGKPEPETLFGNLFLDTCVYHQPGIDLLTNIVPSSAILFASEMIGAVRDIDPRPGFYFDDTKRLVDATPNLTAEERQAVFEGNALRVYPRLAAQIAARAAS
jgi:4-oxalmesaconate hydratase